MNPTTGRIESGSDGSVCFTGTGCLIGGAISDALGGPVELWSRDRIHHECGRRGGVGVSTREHLGSPWLRAYH